MDWLQAIFLALLQGVSELFPVSSLGHLVIVPSLLRWNIQQDAPTYVAFGVMLHLGTAAALFIFYWRDWVAVIGSWFRSLTNAAGLTQEQRGNAHFAWLLIVGTIPTGIIGLIFKSKLEQLFAAPTAACVFLIVNGFIMLGAEALRRRTTAITTVTNSGGSATVRASDEELLREGREPGRELDSLSLAEGAGVGLAQSLALLPGISRSGVTIGAGLLLKLNHSAAARFSFMLATPIIALAALAEVPRLFKPEASGVLPMAVAGAALAGIAAYLSVRFLTRYFKTNRLDIFGYYCIAFGVVAFVLLQFVLK